MGKDLKGKELGTGIRQRKDGRYEARALVKGIEINLYGLNLKELKKDFEQAKEQAKQNVDVRWNNITLNEWFEEWFTKYKVPVIKETSIFPMKSKYYNTFGKILGDKKIVDILNIDIQEAINTMHQQGRASSSMREALGRVRECMESAKRNKIIAENPCFEISVPWENKSKERRFLTKKEQTLFLKTVENNWYKEMLYIMFLTGMRVGEVGGLRWEDVDFGKRMLSIRRTLNRLPKVDYNGVGNSTEIVIQEPKTKNSIRSIPLIPNIANELQQWKMVQQNDAMAAGTAYQDSGFLVTNPLGGYLEPRTFKDFYDEILKASGLGHYTFHALRHTFATRAMEQGMDAKTTSILLGHYSVSFTLDTYTHVLDSQKQEEMKVMEEFFTLPNMSQTQSYAIVVTPMLNGFLLNPIDFDDMSIEAGDLQYGIQCLKTTIAQKLVAMYPPTPTPVNEIVLQQNEFIVMINL